jgi:hypothetical protein
VKTGRCARSRRKTVSSLDKRGEGRSQRQSSKSDEVCTAAEKSADWTDPFYFKRRNKIPRCANLRGVEQALPTYHHGDRVVLDCSPRFDWSRKAEPPPKTTARELRARLRTDLQRKYDSWVRAEWSPTLLRTAKALLFNHQKPADIARSERKSRAAIRLRLISLCQKDQQIRDWWHASCVPQFHRQTDPIRPSKGHPARVVDPWLEVVTSGAAADILTTVEIRTARTRTPVGAHPDNRSSSGPFSGLARAARAINAGLGGPPPARPGTDVYVLTEMLLEGPDDVNMRPLLADGAERMLDYVAAAGLLVPLNGLRVHFFGAVPRESTREVRLALERFWRKYLTLTGAEVVSFAVRESTSCKALGGVAAVA